MSFTFGRPSSIVDSDIKVPDPTDEPFMYALVELARVISNTATRIYRGNHHSLLSVWRAADQTYKELRCFSRKHLGIDRLGSHISPKQGEEGFQHAGLISCKSLNAFLGRQLLIRSIIAYCHTVLLTFLPFLVFRVKSRLTNPTESHSVDAASGSAESPQWLDAACEIALEAARHAIRYLIEACELNQLVRVSRRLAVTVLDMTNMMPANA